MNEQTVSDREREMKLAVMSVLLTHCSQSNVAEDDDDKEATAEHVCTAPGEIMMMIIVGIMRNESDRDTEYFTAINALM